MTQVDPEGRPKGGRINVRVEPSVRIGGGRTGVYVNVNDHYPLAGDEPQTAEAVMEMLENHFDASVQRSNRLIDHVMGLSGRQGAFEEMPVSSVAPVEDWGRDSNVGSTFGWKTTDRAKAADEQVLRATRKEALNGPAAETPQSWNGKKASGHGGHAEATPSCARTGLAEDERGACSNDHVLRAAGMGRIRGRDQRDRVHGAPGRPDCRSLVRGGRGRDPARGSVGVRCAKNAGRQHLSLGNRDPAFGDRAEGAGLTDRVPRPPGDEQEG